MKKRQNQIDRVKLARPCSTEWEVMAGNEQVRYCQQCEKNVYNFSQMTRAEVEELLAGTQGRLCARFERRGDGSILTDDALSLPSARRPLSSGFSRLAVATISAALGFSIPVAASPATTSGSSVLLNRQNKTDQPQPNQGRQTRLAGTIYDASGAVIVGALVILTEEMSGVSKVTISSAQGIYEFTGIGSGTYTLKTGSAGFVSSIYHGIQIQAGQELFRDVTLSVSNETLIGSIAIAESRASKIRRKAAKLVSWPYRGLKALIGS